MRPTLWKEMRICPSVCGILDGIGYCKILHAQSGCFLIHAGEKDQFFSQGSQAGNLFARAFGPLIFALRHFQHLGVGINDCQWCLDFMTCIRNKTLLLFIAFRS